MNPLRQLEDDSIFSMAELDRLIPSPLTNILVLYRHVISSWIM